MGDDVLSNVPFKLKMNFTFLDTVTIIIQGYNFLSYFSNCKINQTLHDKVLYKRNKDLNEERKKKERNLEKKKKKEAVEITEMSQKVLVPVVLSSEHSLTF